jgi:hypothetical protein
MCKPPWSLHGWQGILWHMDVCMGKPKLPPNVTYAFFAYHSSLMSSPPIQWWLGCDWTFWFAPYAPHQNHPNFFHRTMGAHLMYFKSIRCYGCQFGWEGFERLLTSMVLILPPSLRNFSKIWPTMKFCP